MKIYRAKIVGGIYPRCTVSRIIAEPASVLTGPIVMI